VHRVLNLVYRNFDGRVPEPGDLEVVDAALLHQADAAMESVAASLEACRFREALQGAMALARDTNRYLDAQAPWRQVRDDLAGAARTLYSAMYVIAALKVLTYPFLPFSAQRLHEMLGRSGPIQGDGWAVQRPSPGTAIPAPEPLFTKLGDSVAEEQTAKLG